MRRSFEEGDTAASVLSLLREGPRTVTELAEALDLTDNAIRLHLGNMEKDGLVKRAGIRKGIRKPHHEFCITPAAEDLFSKAYEPVLTALVQELSEELHPRRLHEVLTRTGERLGQGAKAPPSWDAKVQSAVSLLKSLGAIVKESVTPEGVCLQGASCPLRSTVASSGETCFIVESLLKEVTGADVHHECIKGESPKCRFSIRKAA